MTNMPFCYIVPSPSTALHLMICVQDLLLDKGFFKYFEVEYTTI